MIGFRDTTARRRASADGAGDVGGPERRYLGSTEGFSEEQTRRYLAHVRSGGEIHVVAAADASLVGWIDIVAEPYEGLTH